MYRFAVRSHSTSRFVIDRGGNLVWEFPGPAWLEQWLWTRTAHWQIPPFAVVHTIRFDEIPITDDDLESIDLSSVRRLGLGGTKVTDAGCSVCT
jgi:hypothetical protein